MSLPELIEYFRNDGTYEGFCKLHRLESDADVTEIYMQKPYGLNNKLEFFKVEETAGKKLYNYNGSDFNYLFDFNYFLSAVKEADRPASRLTTDIDLALRLIDYAERDAY